MSIDVERVRADTPGCENRIHFNNCGAGLLGAPVIKAVKDHIDLEAAIGGYEAAAAAQARHDGIYDSIARLLNCAPDEIALLENATCAWDMVFYGMPFERGDRVLTAMAEYASNYIAFLQVARRTGISIEPVPNDDSGQLSVAALEHMLDERVKLIAVTHVPTNGGLVNPAADIGAVAKKHRIPFLLDACQSAGQVPLDVEAMGVDMLSATGRKYLRGPRGTGFLYVRKEWLERLEPPFLDLHSASWVAPDRYEVRSDAKRFENFESNVAAQLGLGAAVDYALNLGLDPIHRRIVELAADLRSRLSRMPGVTVRDRGVHRCGIVSFTATKREPADIVGALGERGINVSTSTADSSRLDMEQRRLHTLVRAGLHYYNTEDEVSRFCDALREFL